MQTLYDVIIIGGGASGMMAAISAVDHGASVLILEKNNQFGKKLALTGAGRCNITNAQPDIDLLLKNYGKSRKALYSPFAQFGVSDTFHFFEKRGLPLLVEEKNRAFPSTHRAQDVVRVLHTSLLQHSNVDIQTSCEVLSILWKEDYWEVISKKDIWKSKNIILSTGGFSHPETGSSGDGFTWLEKLGHTVIHPTPTLVPLIVAEKWIAAFAGISISNVSITFADKDGGTKIKKRGDILFTHDGLSGPTILNSAQEVKKLLENGDVHAFVDFFPSTNEGELDKEIIQFLEERRNQLLKNVTLQDIPKRIISHILQSGESDLSNIPVHELTSQQRKYIVRKLKHFPLTITGLADISRSIVADGGLPLDEVNMKTMQSRKYPQLYITGDLLHINRPSGGFSLQLCWTTGYVAGTSAAMHKN